MTLKHKLFPIQTETACQLKWNWSTIFLTTEETASCHRVNQHKFDTSTFDFHNTPEKLKQRSLMLEGQWPGDGCEYCKNIEDAGGQSDRITNLNFPGMYPPPELDTDSSAIRVTPRILEVYFDNTCNLKCLYCSPKFSSLWDAENKKFGYFKSQAIDISDKFQKSKNIDSNKEKIFSWLKENGKYLTNFNILGGEPLYQKEFEQCLDLFDEYPAPHLKLQFFTNLNTNLKHLTNIVGRLRKLVGSKKIAGVEITASLDCWGPEQEYVRFPLDLTIWEENFNYLLQHKWINLIISSTVTPLTVKTLPDLLVKIREWNKIRPVAHYQCAPSGPPHFLIDIFGDIFVDDFNRAIALKADTFPEDQSNKNYLLGIAKQSASKRPNLEMIKRLYYFLTEMDRRRGTSWPKTFPWLITEFNKYI
jgi:hypothetical protein